MEQEKLLKLGVEMGRRLMDSGAEIYRVEESVQRLLQAYGQKAQVFAIPSCLIVGIETPDGQSLTKMQRIGAHGTDIEALELCNDLCRRLCREPVPVETALEQLCALDERHRQLPDWVVLLGYLAAAGFFALFFGGGLGDAVSAGIAGVAAGLCVMNGRSHFGSNIFFRTFISAAVGSFVDMVLVRMGLGRDLWAATIGTLMVLVPGMALTNAMREIMAGDILSGMSRTAEVLLVAAAIALGAALPLMLG